MDASQDLSERLEKTYSGAVFDVLRKHGHIRQVLPKEIRPLIPDRKLAGPVYPISGRPDDHLDAHESLILWTELLSKCPAHHVVVTQPHDSIRSHMGELSAETLQFRGIRGYITDGGCRDTEFIEKIRFPVFCRYFTPIDIVGSWRPETFNEPITLGDVTLKPGDFIMADRDGIVAIPGGIIASVVEEVEAVMQTENQVRKAILEGLDPREAYLKYGKF